MDECLQAAIRLTENGPNKLSPPKEKPEWLKYLLQYTNPLLALLIVAGVLTFVAYGIQVLIFASCTTIFHCEFVNALDSDSRHLTWPTYGPEPNMDNYRKNLRACEL
jgi:Cation transporter/ATPase, N-terminus